MKNIKYYLDRYKIWLVLACFIVIIIFFILFNFNSKKDNENLNIVEETETKEPEKTEVQIENIKVDIKGYIKNPGVYEMTINDRVIDVINKAGGLKKDANTEYINLSKKLLDEMVIIIYSNNEVDKFKKEEQEIIYIEYKCECPDNINDSCINDSDVVNTNGSINEKEKNSLISINTDNVSELTNLDGIGESKAKAILQYKKDNGDFKKLEDIMKVPGIGEAAYSKIKDNIKL